MRFVNTAVCIVLSGLMLGSLSSTAAFAAPRGDAAEQRQVVKYWDLDLTRSEGAQELHRRISNAAGDVCDRHRAPLVLQGKVKECMSGAVTRAVAGVDSEELTSYHTEVSGRH